MKFQHHLQWLTPLVAALFILLGTTGCADEDLNVIVLEYDGMSVGSDTSVKASAEDFNGTHYSGKLSAYWPRGSAKLSAELNLRSGSARRIETGRYRLMHPGFRDNSSAPYASLYFDERIHDDLPKHLYSRTGELVLEDFRVRDGKVVYLAYRFAGDFAEKADPSSKERRYPISGRLQYHRQ